MVLTDDNFATLVHAVALGRDIWHKITAYIRYQMSQLFGLVSMFLVAALVDLNSGVALLPMQIIALNFFIAVFPVVAIMTDAADPNVMEERPRDPTIPIFNRTTGPALGGLRAGARAGVPRPPGLGTGRAEHRQRLDGHDDDLRRHRGQHAAVRLRHALRPPGRAHPAPAPLCRHRSAAVG